MIKKCWNQTINDIIWWLNAVNRNFNQAKNYGLQTIKHYKANLYLTKKEIKKLETKLKKLKIEDLKHD